MLILKSEWDIYVFTWVVKEIQIPDIDFSMVGTHPWPHKKLMLSFFSLHFTWLSEVNSDPNSYLSHIITYVTMY